MCGLNYICEVVMVKKIILWIAVITLSLAIFDFSAKTATESAGMSSQIAEKVVDLVEKVVDIDDSQRESVLYTVHLLIRKGAHFLEFVLLSILVFFLAESYKLSRKVCFLIALGYCLVFAASDEFHQLFVNGRSGQISDVMLDFCGALFGACICYLVVKISEKKKNKAQF